MTTYYVGAHYQKQGTQVTKYYYAGAERIAMRQGGVLYYIFGDHLGSTAVVKNTQGGKTELRYTAWGTTRYEYGSTPTDRRFTGQREEASFGLYFYNARWYDPAVGRFIQADTIIPGAGNPQAWDRYAYANNDPVKYSDPSGHSVDCGIGEQNCRAGSYIVSEDDEGNKSYHQNSLEKKQNPNTVIQTCNYCADAGYISFSYSAGLLAWYRAWSIDIVLTNNEVGVFYVDSAGPGLNGYEIPSTIPQSKMDKTYLSPQINGTLFVGALWGKSLNEESVKTYQGISRIEGESVGASFEQFESVDRWTGIPNGEIRGVGLGWGFGLPEMHKVFGDATYLFGFSY